MAEAMREVIQHHYARRILKLACILVDPPTLPAAPDAAAPPEDGEHEDQGDPAAIVHGTMRPASTHGSVVV